MTRFSMGIAGAAVATVIAQGVCCIFCFWFILRRAKVLVPSRKDFSFDSALCRELLEQGFSMGFMLSIVSLGTVALQSSINVPLLGWDQPFPYFRRQACRWFECPRHQVLQVLEWVV